MAGEWLKFDSSTPEKKEVFSITVQLGWDDPDLTVGKLMKVWRWFDQHTIDGNADSVTPALLDRLIGVTGLTQAMANVGWMVITDTGLHLPHFNRHNGKTAKDRALGAKRAANYRSSDESNASSVTNSVTDALPREEKRREEKNKDLKTNTTPSAVSSKFDFEKSLSDAGVPEKHIASWLKVRKAKRGVNTEEAYAGFVREATAAGLTIPDAVLICVERSWAGIKADWLQSKARAATVNSNSPLGKHGQATAENARRWLESQNHSEDAQP